MGSWFDNAAKRSARADAAEEGTGLSRRQVLARGAVVTGAAWTAPMLLAVRPAFAGMSLCTGKEVFKPCTGGTSMCCLPTEECGPDASGTVVCSVPLGGTCGNQGQGQATCNFGQSRCNQPGGNPATNPSICGGPGARCDNGEICIATSPCSTGLNTVGDKRCGGQGSLCRVGSNDCANATINQPATTCVATSPDSTTGVCTA